MGTNITDELSLQSQSLHFQRKDTIFQELSFLSPFKHVLGFTGEMQVCKCGQESQLVCHTIHVSGRTVSEKYSRPAMWWTWVLCKTEAEKTQTHEFHWLLFFNFILKILEFNVWNLGYFQTCGRTPSVLRSSRLQLLIILTVEKSWM